MNDKPATPGAGHGNQESFPLGWKIGLCVLGLLLFATNPWRDLHFFETIAANEGFGTTADSYIIGFAGQLLATIVFSPLAVFMILFGIGRSTRFSIYPQFDRFTVIWGGLASISALLMLFIEADYLLYCLSRPHHWMTALASLSYVGFIYLWWCCSIAQGKESRSAEC